MGSRRELDGGDRVTIANAESLIRSGHRLLLLRDLVLRPGLEIAGIMPLV